MTKAKMDWKHMTLELDGHAGSAPYGKDIVCAAISILTQSLVNALADLQVKEGMTAVHWRGSAEEGKLRIQADVCWANLSLVRGYFMVAVTGLRMIADKYPEYIKFEEE